MIQLFISCYLLLSAALISFMIAGKVIAPFLSVPTTNTYWKRSVELFTGIIFLLFIYSMTRSEGRTVFILLLPLLILYILANFNELKNSFPSVVKMIAWKDLLIDNLTLPVLAFPFYTITFFLLVNPVGGSITMPYMDFFHYSNLSDVLRLKGAEDVFLSTVSFMPTADPKYFNLTQYHFFEEWLTALIRAFSGDSTTLVFFFVTINVLRVQFLLLMLSLFEHFDKKGTFYILLAFAFTGIGGIYLPVYEKFWLTEYFHQYVNTQLGSPIVLKHMVLFIVAAMSLFLVLNKKYVNSVLILIIPIVGNIGVLPPLVGGVTLALPFVRMSRKHRSLLVLYMISIFVGITLFYGRSTKVSFMEDMIILKLLTDPFNLFYYKVIFVDFFVNLIRLCLFTSPFLIIIALQFKKLPIALRWLGLVVFLIVCCGSLMASIAVGFDMALQFYSYIFPVYSVWLIACIISIVSQLQAPSMRQWIVGIVALFSMYNVLVYVFIPSDKIPWIGHGNLDWEDFKSTSGALNDLNEAYVNVLWIVDFNSFTQIRTRSSLPTLCWNNTYENLVYVSPSMDPHAEKGLEQLFLSSNPFYLYWNEHPDYKFNQALSQFSRDNEINFFIEESDDFNMADIQATVVDTAFTDPYTQRVLLEVAYQ